MKLYIFMRRYEFACCLRCLCSDKYNNKKITHFWKKLHKKFAFFVASRKLYMSPITLIYHRSQPVSHWDEESKNHQFWIRPRAVVANVVCVLIRIWAHFRDQMESEEDECILASHIARWVAWLMHCGVGVAIIIKRNK